MTSRQNTPSTVTPILLALCLAVAAVGAYYAYEWVTCGLAMSGVIWDETKYASGYTQQRFSSVRLGWTKQQVEGVLGKPLWKGVVTSPRYSGRRLEEWDYSLKGPMGGHIRSIYFEKGRVFVLEERWESG